jgi:hypothetical protein
MRNLQSIGENRSKLFQTNLPEKCIEETGFMQSANTILSATPLFVKGKLLANNVRRDPGANCPIALGIPTAICGRCGRTEETSITDSR